MEMNDDLQDEQDNQDGLNLLVIDLVESDDEDNVARLPENGDVAVNQDLDEMLARQYNVDDPEMQAAVDDWMQVTDSDHSITDDRKMKPESNVKDGDESDSSTGEDQKMSANEKPPARKGRRRDGIEEEKSSSPDDSDGNERAVKRAKRANEDKSSMAKSPASHSSGTSTESPGSAEHKSSKAGSPASHSSGTSTESPGSAASSKSQSSQKSSASSTPGASSVPKKPRERGTTIGSRVYAEYENTKQWYWATITDIKRKKNSRFDQYSLEFDDGDFTEFASRSTFMTSTQWRSMFSSTKELLKYACGKCTNCSKDDCGRCASCMSNRSSRRGVCLQKMCCEVQLSQKVLPMPLSSNFPLGWTFVIDPEMRGYSREHAKKAQTTVAVDGLKLFAPSGKISYYSVEAAVRHNKITLADVSAEDFYQYIGAIRGSSEPSKKKKTATRGNKACGACENCTSEACGRCARCKSGATRNCFQKMCLEAQPRAVAQPAAGFPDGYRFFFRRLEDDLTPGVMILSPGGRVYGLSGALGYCSLDDPDEAAKAFYTHVGLSAEGNSQRGEVSTAVRRTATLTTSKPTPSTAAYFDTPEARAERKRSTKVGSKVFAEWPANGQWYWATVTAIKKKKKEQYSLRFEDGSGDSLDDASLSSFITEAEHRAANLPDESSSSPNSQKCASARGGKARACGACENCIKEPCGRCAQCTSSKGGVSKKCFQKMCYKMPVEAKMKDAVGFPDEWCFYFAKPHTPTHVRHAAIPNLWILSPGGKIFRSVEAATSFYRLGDGDRIKSEFYNHVGLSFEPRSNSTLVGKIRTTTDDLIVGCQLCFAWNDLNGNRKVVYGSVTECEYNDQSGSVISYKVEYSPQSRALVNAVKNGCGLAVPESQWLEPHLVIGACLQFEEETLGSVEQQLSEYAKQHYHCRWTKPEARYEKHTEGLPCLTVIMRGFCLELKAKPGTGVFLTCTALVENEDDDEHEPFEFRAGELLDLGVCAPCRIEDKKPEAVFCVKSFIHSNVCEERAFAQKDSRDVLDVTDDVTGELHNKAKSQIFAFVKENSDENSITIHAEYDAEGAVHYLLGHGDEAQGSFVVTCDGREVEMFVGARNGCSFGESEDVSEEDKDMAALNKMVSFGAAEVEAAANFLFGLFSMNDSSCFEESVIDRALTSAAMLHSRTRQLLSEAHDDASAEAPSSVNLGRVLTLSKCIVKMILKMVRDEQDVLKVLHAHGNVDGLLKEVLKRQCTGEQMNSIMLALT